MYVEHSGSYTTVDFTMYFVIQKLSYRQEKTSRYVDYTNGGIHGPSYKN